MRVRTILLLLAILAGSLAGQAPTTTRIAGLLDRAIARAQQEIRADRDVWEDHSTWDKAWRARTDHFEVRTTVSYGFGWGIAQGLEVMLGHFRKTLQTDFAPSQPLQVFVLPDLPSYNQFGDDHGGEHSSYYGSFYAAQHPQRPVAVAYDANETLLRMQITHSVVHQFVAAAFPGRQPPLWLDEGLAAYFSLFWSYEWGIDQLKQIAAEDRVVPLRAILRDTPQTFGQSTHERLIELGMLFYYLLRYRDDTRTTLPHEPEQRGPFRDHIVALLRGQRPPRGVVTELLADPGALQRALLEYEFPR